MAEQKMERKGGAERTVEPAGKSDGGGSESVSSAASSIYSKAKRNAGGGHEAPKSR